MGKRIIDDNRLLKMMEDGRTQKEAAEFFGVSEAAVSKKLKRLAPLPESLEPLSDKEKKFALEVAGGKSQTQAAFNSFEVSNRASAKALGNQLMKKPSVNAAISDLMDYHGMDRFYRVGKLKQHVDNADPGISLKALDQSWKLDGAYQEEQLPQTINIQELKIEARSLEEERRKLKEQLAGLDDDVTDAEFEEVSTINEVTSGSKENSSKG
jgi:predicted transcriptional regulator